jgi:hypothetical protein
MKTSYGVKIMIAAACLGAMALSGCAAINSMSATAGVVENSTVQFATAEYISKAGTTVQQLARAQQVKAIAIEIQGLDNGTVTVTQLEAAVTADILKLSPPEQILANALLAEIVANLGVQVNTGVLGATVTAQVNVVMNDVIAACKLYGA